MKRYIKDKVYDTDTAHLVGTWDKDITDGLHWVSESLYRKRTGEYFLFGEGGAATRYAESRDDGGWGSGARIMPLSFDDARTWAQEHLTTAEYDAEFGEPDEGGDTVTTSFVLSTAAKAKLKRVASQQGKTQGQVIEELIMGM